MASTPQRGSLEEQFRSRIDLQCSPPVRTRTHRISDRNHRQTRPVRDQGCLARGDRGFQPAQHGNRSQGQGAGRFNSARTRLGRREHSRSEAQRRRQAGAARRVGRARQRHRVRCQGNRRARARPNERWSRKSAWDRREGTGCAYGAARNGEGLHASRGRAHDQRASPDRAHPQRASHGDCDRIGHPRDRRTGNLMDAWRTGQDGARPWHQGRHRRGRGSTHVGSGGLRTYARGQERTRRWCNTKIHHTRARRNRARDLGQRRSRQGPEPRNGRRRRCTRAPAGRSRSARAQRRADRGRSPGAIKRRSHSRNPGRRGRG